jgi:hypothetical protein
MPRRDRCRGFDKALSFVWSQTAHTVPRTFAGGGSPSPSVVHEPKQLAEGEPGRNVPLVSPVVTLFGDKALVRCSRRPALRDQLAAWAGFRLFRVEHGLGG